MKNTLLFVAYFGLTFYSKAQKVIDTDGNIYGTVTIGSQVWMNENLKTTKFNDGTVILLVTDSMKWIYLTTPGYCWYNNDSQTYQNLYGA